MDKILLIDDDVELVEMLKEYIDLEGFSVNKHVDVTLDFAIVLILVWYGWWIVGSIRLINLFLYQAFRNNVEERVLENEKVKRCLNLNPII